MSRQSAVRERRSARAVNAHVQSSSLVILAVGTGVVLIYVVARGIQLADE